MLPPKAASPLESHEYEVAISATTDLAKLIESHLSYAHAIGAEVARKLPPELERKDIQCAAELGLVEAANSYDATRGVQFKTFAYYRIKGAVYDCLRKMGWYPKGQYQQMRFEIAANEYMKDLSSEPTAASCAQEQISFLKNVTADLLSGYMLSLDSMPQEPEDRSHPSAEEIAVSDQQKSNVRRSLAQLPETNRRILEYFYFEDMTLQDIGCKLGLSKSWVCRLHAKSLEMLRQQLMKLTRAAEAGSSATFLGSIR